MAIAYIHEENAELTAAANGDALAGDISANAAAQMTQTTDKQLVNPPDVILDCKKLSSAAPHKSFVEKFVKCFSVRDNFNLVISTKSAPNAIPVIDGLK